MLSYGIASRGVNKDLELDGHIDVIPAIHAVYIEENCLENGIAIILEAHIIPHYNIVGRTLSSKETISKTSNPAGYTIWSSDANKYILATNGTETNNVTGTNKVMWDGKNTGWANDEKLSTKGLVCLKITGKVKTHNGQNYIIGNSSEDGVIYIPLKGTHAYVGQGDDTSDLNSFFAGKRYTYNIVMKNNVGFKDNGDPILKPILFNASVTGWDDVTVTITL